MSEWKPGDVAMATSRNRPNEFRATFDGKWWREHGEGWDLLLAQPTSVRPLAVIDPGDREQIERLRDLYDAEVIRQIGDPDPLDVTPCDRANALQAALREFASPKPRIEEPTGLGAVIEDAAGVQWLRCFGDAGYVVWRSADRFDERRFRFSDLDAVKVLNDGWSS